MESKKINQLATELTPALSDLTIIGDPTTGISKKITLSQMASLFTGTVEEYTNLAAFPLVGVADTIYIALDTNVLYRWDTTLTSYVELSPNIINSLVFNDANGFDGTISLVGSTATLTITTALTQGSVPFIGASGALSQDNANLFFDDTNNRLGVNTNVPTTALDVFGSGIIGRLNGTSTNNSFLGFASAGTNKWSIGNVQSDHRFRIYSEANTSELVSVLQTGEFGIGIANPTTKLHIDGGASALIANLDANVSVAKSISFRSDNSNRINLEVSGTESGSNAGGNFFIRRYSDAGSLIDTPLTITRSTGEISLSTALSATSATFSAAVVFSSTTSHTGTAGFGIGSPTAIDGSDGRIITNKFRLYNTTPATIYHDFVTAATTNKSITVPDLSGTLALLEGTQTFSGAKTFSSAATFSSSVTAGNGTFIASGAASILSIGTTSTTGAIVVDANRANLVLGAGTSSKIAFNNGSTTQLGYIFNSSSETALGYSGTFNLQLVGGGNVLTATSGGNVGIGTSDPQSSLHIYSTNATAIIQNSSTSAVGNISRLFYRGLLGSGAIGYIGFIDGVLDSTSANTGYLKFHTYNNGNADERMRITSGGTLIVASGVYDTGSSSLWYARQGGNNRIIADGNGYVYMPFLTTGSGIDDLGWWGGSGSSYASGGMLMRISSSARYKKNIRDIEIDTAKIFDLKTISFESNENTATDGLTSFGLLAEDVAEKIPMLATYNEENQPEGVQYKMLSVLLLAEMKKMKAEIELLKSK